MSTTADVSDATRIDARMMSTRFLGPFLMLWQTSRISYLNQLALIAKQFKSESKHVFKHEGNREQFNHESDLKETLKSAFNALVSSKFNSAKEFLEEGMLLVDKRVKLIILADKFGWDFVKEYKRDEIASDSDDEKHIKKCLKSVSAARVQKRKNKFARTSFSAPVPVASRPMFNSRFPVPFSRSPGSMLFRPHRPFVGPCHSCGRYGHYWKACPSRQPGGAGSGRQLVSLPTNTTEFASSRLGAAS